MFRQVLIWLVFLLAAANADARRPQQSRLGYDPAQGSFIEVNEGRQLPRWREKIVWSDRDGRYRFEYVLRDDRSSLETFDAGSGRYRIYHMLPAEQQGRRQKRPMR